MFRSVARAWGVPLIYSRNSTSTLHGLGEDDLKFPLQTHAVKTSNQVNRGTSDWVQIRADMQSEDARLAGGEIFLSKLTS